MKLRSRRTLSIVASLCAGANLFGQGLVPPRIPNTEVIIDRLPPVSAGNVRVERVFPRLGFIMPVQLVEAPGADDVFYVVTLGGVIYRFPNVPDPDPSEVEVFLDISSEICTTGEQGFFSIAFCPDYQTTGEFYVYYSSLLPECGTGVFEAGDTILERFTNVNPSGNEVDYSSRERILTLPQGSIVHKAGMMNFGQDGMLYLSIGDGGGHWTIEGDGTAQDTTNLWGSMIRIDVRSTPDPDLAYRIPRDNPFYDGGPAGGSTRKEIYAYGLRNPWRWSFDMLTGAIFCGDVGGDLAEEINLIEKGLNYGYPHMEGPLCRVTADNSCDSTGFEPPIDFYYHSPGNQAVVGAVTYYGSAFPDLYGFTVYADFTGKFYALKYDGASVVSSSVICDYCGIGPIGFGQDSKGEVYFLDAGWGVPAGIYVLRPAGVTEPHDLPQKLSDMPALLEVASGRGHLVDGVYPYLPSSQLWSDGAIKERYMTLPGVEEISRNNDRGWDFPDKSILVKNFLLPLDDRDPETTAKRIETRLMIKDGSGWRGFTYEWNEEEDDAILLTASKTRQFSRTSATGEPYQYQWYYPNATDCRNCHTPIENEVLGVNTAALNYDFHYPLSGVVDNQLEALAGVDLFTEALEGPVDQLPRKPNYHDITAPLADRARAYLSANCAMCHQPNGPTPVSLDFRWGVPDELTGTMNAVPAAGSFSIPRARIIAPGDPHRSILLTRISARDPLHQMPPLATSQVDEDAVELITEWISSLPRVDDAGGWILQ